LPERPVVLLDELAVLLRYLIGAGQHDGPRVRVDLPPQAELEALQAVGNEGLQAGQFLDVLVHAVVLELAQRLDDRVELSRIDLHAAQHPAQLLGLVDLSAKEHSRPPQLSGGERQRVAIARALANEPPILLADEPTGRLDSASGKRILDLLADLQARRGLTIILVTHEASVAARADRIVRMLDGRIVDEESTHPRPVANASSASQ